MKNVVTNIPVSSTKIKILAILRALGIFMCKYAETLLYEIIKFFVLLADLVVHSHQFFGY